MTDYATLVRKLPRLFDQSQDACELLDGVVARNYSFHSPNAHLLPGKPNYDCAEHDVKFTSKRNDDASQSDGGLHESDAEVDENLRFRFSVFTPSEGETTSGAILLFHGLNERDWSKYLPWAHRLARQTGKAIILFPLAFHMNRAPGVWSRPQNMRRVSTERLSESPTLTNSTFANAAISSRLEAMPSRFCWSGLQTFHDVVDLVDRIRQGEYDAVPADARVDFFAYSIGAFLAEILLMTDPGGRFANARLFTFCGGSTLDRSYPNSRYILDSDATIALYSFFLARFENEVRADERLEHHLSEAHPEGRYFRAMLNYHEQKDVRESRLQELAPRVAALALKRDAVIPANEVLNTLQGDFRDIPIPVTVMDFPYDYNHVIPFPWKGGSDVESAFDTVFQVASAHFDQ
jgi:hypothetical protein